MNQKLELSKMKSVYFETIGNMSKDKVDNKIHPLKIQKIKSGITSLNNEEVNQDELLETSLVSFDEPITLDEQVEGMELISDEDLIQQLKVTNATIMEEIKSIQKEQKTQKQEVQQRMNQILQSIQSGTKHTNEVVTEHLKKATETTIVQTKQLLARLKKVIVDALKKVKPLVSKTLNQLVSFFKVNSVKLLVLIKNSSNKALSNFKEQIVDKVIPKTRDFGKLIATQSKEMVLWVKKYTTQFTQYLLKSSKILFNRIKHFLFTRVKSIGQVVNKGIQMILKTLSKWNVSVMNFIKTTSKSLVVHSKELSLKTFRLVRTSITKCTQSITHLVKKSFEQSKNQCTKMIRWSKNSVLKLSKIKTLITSVYKKSNQGVKSVTKKISLFTKKIVRNFKNVLKTTYQSLILNISKVFKIVIGKINTESIYKKTNSTIEHMVDRLKSLPYRLK